MGNLNRYSMFQCLLVGLVICGLPAANLKADSGDVDAFKSAYAAYQDFEEKGDYVGATPHAAAAYEIGRPMFGDDHANTAALAFNYGQMLLETGDSDGAKEVLREAVIFHENVYGKQSAELIPVLMDLGAASARVFRSGRQKRYYNRALKLARQHYGPESERYGRLLMDAGVGLLNDAQSPAAEKYLEDSYDVLANALGDDAPMAGLSAFQLARLEFAKKRYDDAKTHLLAALRTFEDPDRPSTPIEMSTHAWLVSVYEELGESEAATAHCQAIGRMTPQARDQEYLPLFRKEPIYPAIALTRRKEGFVDVRFTVDHEGIVQNPEVVDGDDWFASSSLDAVKSWRYAPRFVDGAPVTTENVATRLTYRFVD